MAHHFIAISSHFSSGKRIGWHYASEHKLDTTVLQTFIKKADEYCDISDLSIHKLKTECTSWESVVQKDSFFKDIIIYEEEDEDLFLLLISKDKTLSAFDIAKFILSIHPSSHLKLQKLLYYVYVDFLLKTNKRLFEEKILAFKYGPVIEEVFQKYRVNGRKVIGADLKEDSEYYLKTQKNINQAVFMKIITSKDGIQALESIVSTIEKYGQYTAEQLVDKTHEFGGPWHQVYIEGANCEITDEIIKSSYEFTVQ